MLSAGEPPAVTRKMTEPAPARQYSREMLDRIRQSMTAQIAVRDAAEGAMRAPTTEEAAVLAGSSSNTATSVTLKSGGVALRQDVSQMSFAIADLGEDGKARLSHGAGPKPAPAASKAVKGVSDGR